MSWCYKQQGFDGKYSLGLFLITLSLLLLWIPVVIDKLMDFAQFRIGILRQPLPDRLEYVLIYILPVLEILTIVLLIGNSTNCYGMYLSTILMSAFSSYVGIALAGAWEKLPCGCGSVISGMTWKEHFFFNLFFLMLSITGIYLSNKRRSSLAGGETAKGGSAKRLYQNNYFTLKNSEK